VITINDLARRCGRFCRLEKARFKNDSFARLGKCTDEKSNFNHIRHNRSETAVKRCAIPNRDILHKLCGFLLRLNLLARV